MPKKISAATLALVKKRRAKWMAFLEFAERHQSPHWIFRGVADSSGHLLKPKVGRDAAIYDLSLERVIFSNFKRRARQFVNIAGMTEWDLLAMAQHHGLPTRLLDWTTNPLVGAYFAVTSAPFDKTARIFAYKAPPLIDVNKESDPFEVTSVGAFIPSAVVPRIVSQRGLFTVHPEPTTALIPTGGMSGSHHFDIEKENRAYFERKLFGFAVDAAVIKADLDGICESLAWQFRRRVAVGAFNY